MGRFKKLKTLSILIIGILSSVLFLGCSCSKKINPKTIAVDKTDVVLYVGNSVDVKYVITPADSTNTKVSIVVSDPTCISLSQSSFDAIEGTVTITATVVNVSGVTVTFKVDGTNVQTSMVVKIKAEPTKLSTVAGLAFNASSKSILFKNSPGTQSYLINIDGTEYECADPSTSNTEHFVYFSVFNDNANIALNEVHTVKVKPVGDGEVYSDGDYSEEYKFMKYAPVTGVTANNGIVTWDEHQFATMYSIKVNGVEKSVMAQTNSYNLGNVDIGDYYVEISAVSTSLEDENGVKLFASDFTNTYKITKLTNCVLTLDNENLNEFEVIGNSVVTFQAVPGATKYKVKITPQILNVSEFEITENYIEIDDNFVIGTDYTIEVTPLGDVTSTIPATSSSITLKKLGTIGSSQISNNILTIDGLAQASKYAIILKSDQEQIYITSEITTVDLAEQIQACGTYQVLVRPIGQITNNITMANGTLFDTTLTITKIVNPVVSAVNNDGTVHWNEVSNVASYSIYVNNQFVNSSSTNSYKIDTSQLEAGDHNVKIVAVGDGTTTISSGKANAVVYSFTKLPKINASSFDIVNDVVRFDGVENALDYSVKFNDGTYRLIGKVDGKQSVAVDNAVNGTNEVYAVAVGDDVKIISSSPAKYTVSRLEAPTNLHIENGVLVWSGLAGNKYRIYVGDNDEYVETTNTKCDNLQGVAGELDVKVKAIPSSGNYISSDFKTIKVIKLPKVEESNIKVVSIGDNDELSNYKLTWSAVENSTGYNLSISTSDMSEPDTYTGYQATELNLLESYPAGVYTVKIVAVGNFATDTTGYVNSSLTEIEFRKLDKPTGLEVKNNQLTWQDAPNNNPSGYKLGIKYGTRDEFFVTTTTKAYTFDITKFSLDEEITVRIRALGDNVGSVTGAYCDEFKISRSKSVSGLMIKNGEVTWNKIVGETATYMVYGTQTPEDTNSYQLLTTVNTLNTDSTISCSISGIESNQQYSIYVVANVENKLYSENSAILKITKLPTVQNLRIGSKMLSWDAVANATKYCVVDANNNKQETVNTNLSFDTFNYTANGGYSFKVYAIGTASNSEEGYINSNISTSLAVTILEAPNSVSISDNKLIITNSREQLPSSYRVEFDNTSDFSSSIVMITDLRVGIPESGTNTSITQIDLGEIELLGAGYYTISVYCIGNNKELIDSVAPLEIEAVEKLDESTIGVKILNGQVVWTQQDNTTYDVYINNNKVIASTSDATIDFDHLKQNGIFSIEKDVNTIVQVVAKKEGAINSEKTNNFTVVKLPDVKGFVIKSSAIDDTIGNYEYRFSWDGLQSSGYNYSYGNELNKFYYEVVKVSGGDLTDKELVEEELVAKTINLKTTDATNTGIVFEYGKTVSGQFAFNIVAKGTKDSGTSNSGFIDGDMAQNPINVTILSALSLNEYVREQNKIVLNNTNNDGGNRATKIKVVYEIAEPKEDEDKYLFTEDIANSATEYYLKDLDARLYNVWFSVIGSLSTGDYVLGPRENLCLKIDILKAVTEFYSTNGYLNWTHDGGEGVRYQIFIDGVLATYDTYELIEPENPTDPDNPENPEQPTDPENPVDPEQPVEPQTQSEGDESEEPQYRLVTVSSFADPTDARKINDQIINDNLTHIIKIKAIKEFDASDDIIVADSKLSEGLTATKLEGAYNVKIQNGYLYWSGSESDGVEHAEGYIIRSENGEMSTMFGDRYDASRDGYYANGNDAGKLGVMLPTVIGAGTYSFFVVSEGSTTADITELAYLTSGMNDSCVATVLSQPYSIYTYNGVACWDSVANNSGYKVEIYKGKAEELDETSGFESFTTTKTEVDLESETSYPSGYYTLKIYSLGDGSNYLNSSISNPTTKTVYKAPKPEDVGGEFKVRNGYLSWSVPLNNEYLLALNNGAEYDENTSTGLELAAKGDASADATLSQNLEFFRNVEVTINGKVYQNQKAFKIKLDTTTKELIYYYDFNFSTIKNTYKLSVRFMGGSRGVSADGGDPIYAYLNNSYNSKLLEDEEGVIDGADGDGGEGNEGDPGQGGGGFSQEVIYVVNGNYSSTVEGYKLIAPQTPVEPTQTMVYNDCLYFSKVTPVNNYDTNYLIIADCMDEQKEDIEFIIDSTKKSQYEQTIANGAGNNAYFKVPISDLKIDPGYIYTLKVKALGTVDSATSSGVIYFTSNYDHSCEVEMLSNPEVKVTGGDVAVTSIQTAITQEIKIWSTALGSSYKFEESLENQTNDPNKVAQVITLTPAGAEEDNPHYSFVSVENGFFNYSFTDNGYLPVGSYYVTSRAIGDRVEKISSDTSTPITIYKYGEITAMSLSGGKFTWEAATCVVGATTSYPANYNIEVLRRIVGENEYISLGTTKVKTSDILLDSTDNRYCYYDLDSLQYPATDSDGNRYEYSIKVSPIGTTDSDSVVGEQLYYVSGNSKQSGFYKRLLAPQEVKMVNGVLSWKEVEGGFKYEVYRVSEKLEDDGTEFSYSLITNDNYRYLTFSAAENFEKDGVFSLRIRAIPGSETQQYLNGEYCIEVLAKQLEQPLLRVENGIIKWNNTDLNYAIATGVTVKLQHLSKESDESGTIIIDQEFDITDAINTPEGYSLVGTDEEIPSGYYKIEVSYLGSNGYVTESTFKDETTPEGDGEDENNPSEEQPTEPEEPSVDPGEDEENGGEEAGGEEDDEFKDLGNYCWFSSKPASMTVFKLPTPVAELYIGSKDDAPVNYISVSEIENARYYQFTVVKYNSEGEVVKTHTFSPYDSYSDSNSYYVSYNKHVMFNLQAVTDLDNLSPDQPNPFGQEFSVYCQAYGEDALYSTVGKKFCLTNKSNEVAIEVPLIPTGLNVNPSTGDISWINASNNTKTRVRIYYNGSTTPSITNLEVGVNSYKIQTMGTYRVSVLSYIDDVNGLEMSSAYTEEETGTCSIFESGSGTETDPYILKESKHVINIDYYLNSYFKFGANIALSETILSESVSTFVIGRTKGAVFNGTIDGAGYTLSNVRFTLKQEVEQIALIRQIGTTGVVKNLIVGINSGSGYYRASKIAGITITNNGTISNVQTKAYSLSGKDGELLYYPLKTQSVAGIAVDNNGTIVNAINKMLIKKYTEISKMGTNVAGIAVSNNKNAQISECGNTAALGGLCVGGIVVSNYSTISKCYSTGNITAEAFEGTAQAKAGGIVVNNMDSTSRGQGTISTCYVIIDKFIVAGLSNGTATHYGAGIVCDNSSTNENTVDKCYVVLGDVSISGGKDSGKNNKFGAIVAVDDSRNANIVSYYPNNYYYVYGTSTITIGAHGNSSINLTGVTLSTSKQSLITSLSNSLGDDYKADSANINNGYLVFEWQMKDDILK